MGPVNSAQVHCSQRTGSTNAAGENKKKKKKKENVKRETQDAQRPIQTHTILRFQTY